MNISELDTPCVIIDQDIVDRNIKATADFFATTHLKLRPHIKTHKLPAYAKLQLEHGAVGITCQKISEAEIFANAGISDILISYNILGEFKLNRLAKLTTKCKLKTVADSRYVVDGLSKCFTKLNATIDILVECDTGMGRCGVQSPQAAVELGKYIASKTGVNFAGIMIYPASNQWQSVEDFCRQTKALCLAQIGHCETISIGGTPFMRGAKIVTSATEHRPGTYIYNDRSLISKSQCVIADCALTVLAQIVSRPTENRGIIDAGSKSLTSDLLGLENYGLIKQYPQAKIIALSEEHGHIDFSDCETKPSIGEKINIIPNHVCPVTNLYDQVFIYRDQKTIKTLPIKARGMVF
ncbi:MAG: D-TA family PLP-dependent enzyme [Rhizobiales bacterium]|nr:D-TA family PLP-dependent enzyme [Hyphomicrobiales bacterium]NRB13130.1 D-TA family PLP-dependent enzyme [Hyphomicrobiales bacterium]